MSRERLEACGFRLAELPFRGVAGRELWFATRVDPETGAKHWFAVDLISERVERWTNRACDAAGSWSIDETCQQFRLADSASLTFLERCQAAGFRTVPADAHERFQNHYGSLGDGSKWLLCESAEKLIRFDVAPLQQWRLVNLQLVSCEPNYSNPIRRAGDVSPLIPNPDPPPRPDLRTEPWRPLEYSGATKQGGLFDDDESNPWAA